MPGEILNFFFYRKFENSITMRFCVLLRLSDEDDSYIDGFKPNATKMTAHHILLYGCEEPGNNL